MFAQVIQGKVFDAEAIRAVDDRWMKHLAPGADGWLGSTGGTTKDGRFITVVRFESEEAARRNSERPEQSRWWAETEKLFDGGATFQDSTDVTLDLQGDPEQARFVQIMRHKDNRHTQHGFAQVLKVGVELAPGGGAVFQRRVDQDARREIG